MLNDVLSQLDASRDAAVSRLMDFLRIPSVSTQEEQRGSVASCAARLASELQGMRLEARVYPTAGHPIVLAHNERITGRPTVLLYGHYDVQPAEPLELWTSPPFEPAVRDGAIYARGACDDKGQVWAHVEAIRAWQKLGGLPVNVILMIEGEEEIGSPNLLAFIEEHRKELTADIAVISDTSQFARGVPAITYGLRGLVYEEIFLEGPGHDLHSGVFGGAVPNAANILCQLIGSLHDAQSKVNIPGFYDDVLPLDDHERDLWRQLPADESKLARELGLAALTGETGFSALERTWARPTCDVNGITTGYQAEGAKTVIPAKASAKISMRLVPNQNPGKIRELFEKALRERCPASVKLQFKNHGLAEAQIVPLESKAMELAGEAVKIGFGQSPVFMRDGGSIPVVSVIKNLLGIDTIMVGFGLPDDCIHAPNEKFDLAAFYSGMRTAAALYERLGTLEEK